MRHRCFILVLITLGLISACSASPPTPIITAPIDPTSTTSPWQVTSDVIFASSLQEGGDSWMLDIYAPNEPGTWPVVVFLHGFGAS